MKRREQPDFSHLPPEIYDVVYEDPIGISTDDIDTDMFGEDNRELIEDLTGIIIKWHNMPLIYDNFDTHSDRRTWRKRLENKYGANSKEVEFIKENKLRKNKISNVISSIYPLLDLGGFTDEDKERISGELKELIDLLDGNDNVQESLPVIKRLERISLEVLERFVRRPCTESEFLAVTVSVSQRALELRKKK